MFLCKSCNGQGIWQVIFNVHEIILEVIGSFIIKQWKLSYKSFLGLYTAETDDCVIRTSGPLLIQQNKQTIVY